MTTRKTQVLPTANRYELNDRRKSAVEAVKLCHSALTGHVPQGYATPSEVIEAAKAACKRVEVENDNRLTKLEREIGTEPDDEDIVLSTTEAAQFLGVTANTLRKRIKRGHGHPPCVMEGDFYKFRKGQVRQWLKNREIGARVGRPRTGPKKGGRKKRRFE